MGSQPLRTLSQQSFSQGTSLSQLSQSSFEENLTNDQRFSSQDRDNSSKGLSALVRIASTREESQLSKTSNNVFRRWNSSSLSERCQVSDELEHRLRLVETSLNRLGLILDNVQNDVMQVNRTARDVSFETEGIRQKILAVENTMLQLLKGQEDSKASLDANRKSDSDGVKINELLSAITSVPDKIKAHLLNVQEHMCMAFGKELQAVMKMVESFKSRLTVPTCSLMHVDSSKNNQPPVHDQALQDDTHTAVQRFQRNPVPSKTIPVAQPQQVSHAGWMTISKNGLQRPTVLQPKMTDSKRKIVTFPKQELPVRSKVPDFRVTIDSDDEIDADASYHIVKKEIERESFSIEDAQEETLQILQKARRKRRRQNNSIIFV